MQSAYPLALGYLCLIEASSLSACSSNLSPPLPTACGSERADCIDLAPVAQIHYQTAIPDDDADYPYGEDVRPLRSAVPRASVYLSAHGSTDPEGQDITYFWNVQDPTAAYQTLFPRPTAARASFVARGVGEYTITLQATETGGLHQTAQATLKLEVAPYACAADGFSAPCSDLLPVVGGTFQMGSSETTGESNERPLHTTHVADFTLDQYEVTVGRFRRYLAKFDAALPLAADGGHPLIPNSGWRAGWNSKLPATRDEFGFAISECGGSWTAEPGANEARPIGCITWYEAFAFCVSEGKRLPTEAEWEYAAAGGDQQRLYPWGSEHPSNARAVFGCSFDGMPSCSDADLPVVGSTPAGAARFGQLDLAGSLWEWTLDAYAPYVATPCDNCADTSDEPTSVRVFRGGDFSYDDPSVLRAASRYAFNAAFPDQTRGLRCARSGSVAR